MQSRLMMQGSEIRRDGGSWGLHPQGESFGLNAGCAHLNCQGNSAGIGRGLMEQGSVVRVIPGLVKPGILKSFGMIMAMGEEAGIRVFMIPPLESLVTGMLLREALMKP